MVSDAPRYATLRDYLRVLRGNGALIVLVILVFAGAAFAFTSRQHKEYSAESALAFEDPTQDFQLIGTTPAQSEQSPDQRAAVKAESVSRPPVLSRVAKSLGGRITVDQLQGDITARAEARTNLVIVEARSPNPRFAARLANLVAKATQAVELRAERARFELAARSLSSSFRRARKRQPAGNAFVRALAEETIARLRALRGFASPVQVTRRAEVPTTPVSPHPVRNTLFGGLLGLALGVLVAFARDSLDVRFRRPGQAQAELDLPLLGQVSKRALRAGPGTGGRHHLEQSDVEGFQILRANLEFLDSERVVRTVAVTSPGPEEGKSTVASALAAASASVGRNALLLECDLRRPSLARSLGLADGPGLSDYLAGESSLPDVLRVLPVSTEPANGSKGGNGGPVGASSATFACVTAGSHPVMPAEVLGSSGFHDFLAVVGRSYDIVVLDCGPLLPVVDTLALIPAVDAVLLCIRASSTTRDQARAAKGALARLPTLPIGLVLTGVSSKGEPDYGYYQAAPAAPASRRV
jgi:Mrp family chromosome partitioning ATPase/capsular polysaccharide biosynthesis protein